MTWAGRRILSRWDLVDMLSGISPITLYFHKIWGRIDFWKMILKREREREREREGKLIILFRGTSFKEYDNHSELFYFILIYILPKRNISHLISWLAALDGFLLVFCQEITLKSLSKQILIINNNIKWLVDPINSSFFTLYWSHFIVVWSFLFHLEGFWHK